jgi:ADP-ribosylarginine hydrolase
MAWDYFENAWKKYLDLRNLTSGNNRPVFPQNFDIEARDNFYSSLSFAGWGGASGHDAPMIAYDATLGSDDPILYQRGIKHLL